MNRQQTAMTLSAVMGAGLMGYAAARALRPRYRFTGRVVVITGGSRGLGLVMARQLAHEGARLVLLARDERELCVAAAELAHHTEVLAIPCDVTRRDHVDRAIEHAVLHFDRIDVLINNAGIIQVGPLDNLSVQDFRDTMDVHLFGPLYLSAAVVPYMRQQGGGRIVNIASIGGRVAVPHLLPYTASKFALVGLSDGLRMELRREGIYVTTVCPGLMRTGSPPNALFKGRHQAEYAWFTIGDALPGLSLSAETAAHRILEACRHRRSRVTLGLPAKVAVALNDLFPETVTRLASLVNRMLPSADPDASTAAWSGWESRSAIAPSLATALSDRATRRNNEQVREAAELV